MKAMSGYWGVGPVQDREVRTVWLQNAFSKQMVSVMAFAKGRRRMSDVWVGRSVLLVCWLLLSKTWTAPADLEAKFAHTSEPFA